MRPDGIRTLVIDEADVLMGGTFEADVLFIHSMLPDVAGARVLRHVPTGNARQLETLMRQPQNIQLCTQRRRVWRCDNLCPSSTTWRRKGRRNRKRRRRRGRGWRRRREEETRR